VAFPVCISVNECVCHCSPLESDTEVGGQPFILCLQASVPMWCKTCAV
jgi:hypothetical protein